MARWLEAENLTRPFREAGPFFVIVSTLNTLHWLLCHCSGVAFVPEKQRRRRSFLPKRSLRLNPGPGMTPGWAIKVPNTSFPIAWDVFWPIIQFPGRFFCSIWHPVILAIFDPKTPIFGPTWTWNDTWMGHKSAQNIFPHWLGCALVHYPVSRLIFLLNMATCHFGCF